MYIWDNAINYIYKYNKKNIAKIIQNNMAQKIIASSPLFQKVEGQKVMLFEWHEMK